MKNNTKRNYLDRWFITKMKLCVRLVFVANRGCCLFHFTDIVTYTYVDCNSAWYIKKNKNKIHKTNSAWSILVGIFSLSLSLCERSKSFEVYRIRCYLLKPFKQTNVEKWMKQRRKNGMKTNCCRLKLWQ